ncbi:hypothetical protein F5Y11DRAFT_340120 [Daldinia sp. FL1419]|nr:hypothetical protein F5Y11DRAFT_340120 [Daldinia sp. FL1419]
MLSTLTLHCSAVLRGREARIVRGHKTNIPPATRSETATPPGDPARFITVVEQKLVCWSVGLLVCLQVAGLLFQPCKPYIHLVSINARFADDGLSASASGWGNLGWLVRAPISPYYLHTNGSHVLQHLDTMLYIKLGKDHPRCCLRTYGLHLLPRRTVSTMHDERCKIDVAMHELAQLSKVQYLHLHVYSRCGFCRLETNRAR